MKNIKIYDVQYLCDNDLSEEDLYYIFETKSLYYSLIAEIYKMMNIDYNYNKILSFNNWEKIKYKWNKKQQNIFYNNLKNAYKNIYQIGDINASFKSDWWCFLYGPKINK